MDTAPSGRRAVSLWLELEPKCNLRCAFCYNYWKDGSTAAPKAISVKSLLAGLDRLLEFVECKKAALSGGEPLVYTQLETVVRYFRKREVPTVLTSNGVLLTEDRLCRLVGEGLGGIQIPLHAASPDLHDELSGGPSWHASLRAIVLAQRLSVSVTPVFVGTRRNVHELPLVIELLSLLGIKHIIANRFTPAGLGLLNRDALWLDDAMFIDSLRAANRVAEGHGAVIELGVPVPLSAEVAGELTCVATTSCPIGMEDTQYTVDPAGNFKECSQSSVALGNILTHDFGAMRRHGLTPVDIDELGVQPCRFCACGPPAPKETPVTLLRRASAASGGANLGVLRVVPRDG